MDWLVDMYGLYIFGTNDDGCAYTPGYWEGAANALSTWERHSAKKERRRKRRKQSFTKAHMRQAFDSCLAQDYFEPDHLNEIGRYRKNGIKLHPRHGFASWAYWSNELPVKTRVLDEEYRSRISDWLSGDDVAMKELATLDEAHDDELSFWSKVYETIDEWSEDAYYLNLPNRRELRICALAAAEEGMYAFTEVMERLDREKDMYSFTKSMEDFDSLNREFLDWWINV